MFIHNFDNNSFNVTDVQKLFCFGHYLFFVAYCAQLLDVRSKQSFFTYNRRKSRVSVVPLSSFSSKPTNSKMLSNRSLTYRNKNAPYSCNNMPVDLMINLKADQAERC